MKRQRRQEPPADVRALHVRALLGDFNDFDGMVFREVYKRTHGDSIVDLVVADIDLAINFRMAGFPRCVY